LGIWRQIAQELYDIKLKLWAWFKLDLTFAVKSFRGFGGQDGFDISAAVFHKKMDVIDGYFQSAHSVRPNS
jgi:hypothetical protein